MIYNKLLEKYKSLLNKINKVLSNYKNLEIKYLKICDQDPPLINNIPELLNNEEFLIKAIQKNPAIFKYIPKSKQTAKLNCEALKLHGHLLQYIENQNDELCKIAIKKHPSSLSLVYNITEELVDYAIENGISLSKVPEKFRNYERCKKAVEYYGGNISNVPSFLIDFYLAKEAIKETGIYYTSIPFHLRTLEIKQIALINSQFSMLRYMEEDFQIQLWALNENPKSLEYIDKDLNQNNDVEKTKQFLKSLILKKESILKLL